MRFLPQETAQDILYSEFWLPIRGDELPFPLAYQLFDISTHSGPSRAVSLLQETLKVAKDGILGPITMRAAQSADTLPTCKALLLSRHEFQRKLPAWKTDFGAGWARRNLENAFYLADDLLSPD
jgi:lysozyme family protein